MCGENLMTRGALIRSRGSPPRVRGKPDNLSEANKRFRITPACAGKTVRPVCRPGDCRDHPRVCGENRVHLLAEALCRGSPPRVRGKPHVLTTCCDSPRITPACAGKTTSTLLTPTAYKDHPRVCGENRNFHQGRRGSGGSPPRVRGKRCKGFCAGRLVRITPACAGKTGIQSYGLIKCQDHPRVCGENDSFRPDFIKVKGSPPRVRGKLQSLVLVEI